MPIISMLSEFIKINMILVDLFCIELCNYFSSFCNGRSLRFLVQISLTLLGLIPIFWIFLMNYIRERTSSTIKMAAQIVEERFKVSKGDLVLFTRSDIFNFLKDRVENDKNIKDYDRKLGFYENYNQEFHHYFKIAFYSIFLAFLLFLITFFKLLSVNSVLLRL